MARVTRLIREAAVSVDVEPPASPDGCWCLEQYFSELAERFEANRALTEAQALYHQQGYREVERFNDEPYAHHWFEKSL